MHVFSSFYDHFRCNNSSKKRCGPAIKKTTLSKEVLNDYDEALKIIRSEHRIFISFMVDITEYYMFDLLM